jgi:hypothetical protein
MTSGPNPTLEAPTGAAVPDSAGQPKTAPDPDAPLRANWAERAVRCATRAARQSAAFYRDRDPTFRGAFARALAVSAVLFVRSPSSNYIFDEQEALLANPFVNGRVPFKDVLTRDFWGLPHDRSIGSYRPLPNVIWRAIWQIHPVFRHPWALHWINIVIHAVNAALVARIALKLTGNRAASWLAGAAFVSSAVLTEAVTGVVGIADVLGALGLLAALVALEWSLPLMAAGVFAFVCVGLFSKESTLVALPIVAWFALLAAPVHHPARPRRIARAAVALVAATAALALYTDVRRRFFPAELPELRAPLPASATWVERGFRAFLRWFQQPRLPQDPINNPLIHADTAHRIAGALGVYASGVGQVLFPWTLSGDYSFAQEPIPPRVVSVRSVLGALLLILPVVVGIGLFVRTLVAERKGELATARERIAVAIALVWAPVAYFPHSNIPITLPTVRAERFWYLPVAGLALALGPVLAALVRRSARGGLERFGAALAVFFLAFQAARARMHALDYTDDLVFWRATSRAVPMSAKAHLNYGVMLGARGDLNGRLVENRRAVEIAPAWPMAHIYFADTLCRLNRSWEAWPDYRAGLLLAPNDRNLIALALQCMWEHNAIHAVESDLLKLADHHPGSWLSYLAHDVVTNGTAHGGVDRKYRPRGYDEGPTE